MTIFACESYLEVLRRQTKENKDRSGYLSKLAKAAGMHLSYLTRVFKEEAHLTPDHAAGLAEFWGFTEDEAQFFLFLVIRDRAATPRLKKMADAQLTAFRRQHDRPGIRGATSEIPDLHKSIYYSSWRYTVLHVALFAPSLRKEEALSRRFGLPLNVVSETLQQLEKMGLVVRSGQGWKRDETTNFALDGRSWLGESYTRAWRQRLADRQITVGEEELSFTGVHAISLKDAPKIRRILKEALAACREIMDPSPAEELYVLCVDWTKT